MSKENRIGQNGLPPELIRLLVITGMITGGCTALVAQNRIDRKASVTTKVNLPAIYAEASTTVIDQDYRILPPAVPGEQPVKISTETKMVTVQKNDTVYKILSRLGFKDTELNEAYSEFLRLNPQIPSSGLIHSSNVIECPLPD